jgi:hypothetical protein
MDHDSNRTKPPTGFERRVLRKIYGSTQNNAGTCRIKTNEELEILIKKENIIRFIKSQRLRWAAHVIRMDTKRIVKKLTEWDPSLSNFLTEMHRNIFRKPFTAIFVLSVTFLALWS